MPVPVDTLPAWIGIGLTALALTGGCVAYVHAIAARGHDRTDSKLAALKQELRAEMDQERIERLAADEAERSERRREMDKLSGAIDSFRSFGATVTGMGQDVKHLGERFNDHRDTVNRDFDELKHSIRSLDARVQMIPVGQQRRTFRKPPGEDDGE